MKKKKSKKKKWKKEKKKKGKGLIFWCFENRKTVIVYDF